MAVVKLDEEFLRTLEDNALAEVASVMEQEGYVLVENGRRARHMLLARLEDKGARLLETEDWTGKVTPGTLSHNIEDPEGLKSALLVAGMTAEAVDMTLVPPAPPTLRFDGRALKRLIDMGGAVADVIHAFRDSDRGPGKLALTRKPEPEPKPKPAKAKRKKAG